MKKHISVSECITSFHTGSQYWVFKDTMVVAGYPRPLSDWGLISHDGSEVKRVDAAFIWAHNGKTYIFSGGEFWRFSEGLESGRRRPDADYPRNSSLWKGAPSIPDDIITWGDGNVEKVCFSSAFSASLLHYQLTIAKKLWLQLLSLRSVGSQ